MSGKNNKTKNKIQTKKQDSKKSELVESLSPIFIDKAGLINLRVQGKPSAKISQITDISEDSVGIQINAPPIDGEANTELIKYLSKICSLRKSDISISFGNKCRTKTIVFAKDCISKESLYDILKANIDS